MKVIIYIFYICFIYADYNAGFAGSTYRYENNARAFALSGADIANKSPGFYAFSNPSLLKYVRNSQLGISLQSMSLDRSLQNISYVKKLPPMAGVGISLLRVGTSNIMGRDYENNKIGEFSNYEVQGIISFGISIGAKQAVGINIKTFYSSIAHEIGYDESGRGIGWDIGYLFQLNYNVLLALVIENLNSDYKWNQDRYKEKLPQILKLGLHYKLQNLSIYFQEDIVHLNRNYMNYRTRAGLEYDLSNGIYLRGGIKQKRALKPISEKYNIFNNFKPSFGVGVPINIWKKHHAYFDYSLDLGIEHEGVGHLFSFIIDFKKK